MAFIAGTDDDFGDGAAARASTLRRRRRRNLHGRRRRCSAMKEAAGLRGTTCWAHAHESPQRPLPRHKQARVRVLLRCSACIGSATHAKIAKAPLSSSKARF
jgi:hypothetical protein